MTIEGVEHNPVALAFLAGAGISITRPSALPDAAALITRLIECLTDDSALQDALNDRLFINAKGEGTDFLRFEAVMGAVRHTVDPKLQLLGIYSTCTKPNGTHYFLARKLAEGAFVLTTNFDNLIELACADLGVPYSLIITDDDFRSFASAPERFRNPILKLHGGHNLLAGHAAGASGPVNIVATMEDFGSLYMRREVETPMLSAFAAALVSRHLCVVGYSGCDDFDIMPFLLKHPLSRGCTWLHHADSQTETLRESVPDQNGLPPYRMLKRAGSGIDVSVVQGRTQTILGITQGSKSSDTFEWTAVYDEWLGACLSTRAHRDWLLGNLLVLIGSFDRALDLLEHVPASLLNGAQQEALYFMRGCIYSQLSEYDKAILNLSEVILSDNHETTLRLKGFAFYNLGRINTTLGNSREGATYLREAWESFKEAHDLGRMIDCIYEQGRICIDVGDYTQAMAFSLDALSASEQLGDIAGAAFCHCQIARVLTFRAEYQDAESHLSKAATMFRLTSNHYGLGIAAHAHGYLLVQREEYLPASHQFQEAITHFRETGAQIDLGHSLHCLGDMRIIMRDFAGAEQALTESLKIKRSINDRTGIANSERALANLMAYRRILGAVELGQ